MEQAITSTDEWVFRGGATDRNVIGSPAISPDGNEASWSFERLLVDLDAAQNHHSDTCALSFHLTSSLKGTRPRLKVDLRFNVRKSPWCLAKLVVAAGETLKSLDFLFGSELEGDQFLSFECPARKEAKGKPFQFTIVLLAQRIGEEEHVRLEVDTMDVSVVSDNGGHVP